MATKTFNIGECAVGGRIQITHNTKDKTVNVKALSWFDKKVVNDVTFSEEVKRDIQDHLSELSTHYYGCKMMEWLEPKLPTKQPWEY